jgi:hypothetical protein
VDYHPFEIPVSELRPGLTVFKPHGSKWVPDVYLADYLLGDYPPREFVMGRRLQFKTGDGRLVTWHNCGTVMVLVGKGKYKSNG